jgi:predicted GNAT family N-acyltransferase
VLATLLQSRKPAGKYAINLPGDQLPLQDSLGEVRIARTREELDRIYRLRYDVYITEMQEPLRANHSERLLFDEWDHQAVHFYIEREGLVAGVARLHVGNIPEYLVEPLGLDLFRERNPNRLAYVSRLIMAKWARRSTTTASLMCAVYKYARTHQVDLGFLHCYPRLVPLYTRLGFQRYLHTFEAPQGTQTPLVLAMGDAEHLREVGSILAPVAAAFPRDPEPAAWLNRRIANGHFPLFHENPAFAMSGNLLRLSAAMA